MATGDENETERLTVYGPAPWKDNWEDRFRDAEFGDVYEWWVTWNEIKPYLERHLELKDERTRRALHVGCGNSDMAADLVTDDFFDEVESIDLSAAAVSHMQQRHAHLAQLSYTELNANRIGEHFEADLFDAVFDKGTLEAIGMLHSGQYLSGVAKVLCEHGLFVLITSTPPNEVSRLLTMVKGVMFHLMDHRETNCTSSHHGQNPLRPEIKLVGFTVDSKLRWGSMIDRLARKVRSRIGALRQISQCLDSRSMKLMYTSFICSFMEYGSIAWMGAAQSHLDKLDRVQRSAQRIGGFHVQPLQIRREAHAISFAIKMLSGSCKGVLNDDSPQLHYPRNSLNRSSRHSASGLQVKPQFTAKSLDVYIWSKLPQEILTRGHTEDLHKILRKCKSSLLRKKLHNPLDN